MEVQTGIPKSSDDKNKTNTVSITREVAVEEIEINGCDVNHMGNRNIYRGEVTVNNIVEISGTQNLPVSTTLTYPNTVEFIANQGVNASSYSQFLPYVRSGSRENGINRSQESHSVPSSNAEEAPLIDKTESQLFTIRVEYCILLLVIIGFIIILTMALSIIYGHADDSSDSSNLPINFTHIFRDRLKWQSMRPKRDILHFKYIPPEFVVVGHTATKECNTPSSCEIVIRNIQAAQMAAQYDDIAYNFLVGGDGLIYEGRGWRKRSASVIGMDCSSLLVAFVGNFDNNVPPNVQISAFATLVDTGENYGKLKKNYKMFMENDITGLESPGRALIEILRKWLHWTPFSSQYLLCKVKTN